MEYAFFHWGFHPWAMYAVIGLSIGYFAYRKGYGNLVSATFRPLLGDKVAGGPGKAIDVLAIFATLFGTATSLGLGALQITGGIDNVFGEGGGDETLAVDRDRGAHRLLRGVGGVGRGQGHQVPVQRQRHRGRPAGVLPVRRRADRVHPGHLHRDHGRLPHPAARPELRDRGLRWQRVAQRLDDLLLGLVDQLDPLRRHVHRAHLQGPHDPPVRDLRDPGPEPGVVRLVLHPRRLGDRPAAQRGLVAADDRHRRHRPRGGALRHAA